MMHKSSEFPGGDYEQILARGTRIGPVLPEKIKSRVRNVKIVVDKNNPGKKTFFKVNCQLIDPLVHRAPKKLIESKSRRLLDGGNRTISSDRMQEPKSSISAWAHHGGTELEDQDDQLTAYLSQELSKEQSN